MTTSTSKHYYGHCKAAEVKSDLNITRIEIWIQKCGRRASEQKEDKGDRLRHAAACASQGVTRRKVKSS